MVCVFLLKGVGSCYLGHRSIGSITTYHRGPSLAKYLLFDASQPEDMRFTELRSSVFVARTFSSASYSAARASMDTSST